MNETQKPTFLTKKTFMEGSELHMEPLDLTAECGGWVMIKEMTGAERDQYDAMVFGKVKDKDDPNMAAKVMDNIRAKMACMTVCNEDGKRLFNLEDVKKLGKRSSIALDKIFDKAKEVNGMSDEEMTGLEKNFESGQSDGSG